MIISNCWACNGNAHQLPVRKQNLRCLPQQLSLEKKHSVIFVPLDEMFEQQSLLWSTSVYMHGHHTQNQSWCSAAAWSVVFHWRRTNNDAGSQTFQPSACGLQKMSLQMPLVFARCIPKVCYLQEIYETRLWYQYVLYMLRYFKWKVWPDVGTTRSPTSLRLILEGTLICFTFNPAAVGLFKLENIPYMYLLVVLEEKSEDRLSPLARSSGDHECFYKMPQQSIWKSLRYLSLD